MASVAASRAHSGAACSSSGRSMSASSSKSSSRKSSRGFSFSSSCLLGDRCFQSSPASAARGLFLGHRASSRLQTSALGFSLTCSRLTCDYLGKTSSTRGRIPVRSVQSDGDEDGATTTTTTSTTTSTSTKIAAASAKLRALLAAVPDRGVYGLPSEQKEAILLAIAELEALDGSDGGEDGNETAATSSVAERLPALAGRWRVLFSTVTITGSKRVKLGLKSAVTLGELTQEIDAENGTAANEVAFELRFLGGRGGRGSLRLEARFEVAGPNHPRRVDIALSRAALTPPALDALLGQHMELLLSIFNPEGWLETTFFSSGEGEGEGEGRAGGLRVGRDDKGRVFVLERVVGFDKV